MIQYRNLISVYNGLKGRENPEWSNFWYDDADDNSKKRYLIVGDSTARMVRSTFAKLSHSPCDLLGTSCALDDELFVNQLEAFFNNTIYKYDIIYVQLGHHSRINKNGEPYQENDYIKFEHDFTALCNYLNQFCRKIVVESVFMSVMPKIHKRKVRGARMLRKLGLLKTEKEIPDEIANSIKRRKNKIIENVAIKNKYFFCDLCSFMEEKKIPHIDHIHYVESAKPIIVYKMMEFIDYAY